MWYRLVCLFAGGFLLAGCANLASGEDADFNSRVLASLRTMPRGGGYDGSDATKNLLAEACTLSDDKIGVQAEKAKPSFCSGATYLLLLKALDQGSQALLPKIDHQDGHGIFGRWNANGPGVAKLVADLGAGHNFVSWETARPGDFLKIWWNDHIGAGERGHLVVYLGHDADQVRFWSSNQPNGYGTKTVPKAKCRRVLFSRITHPQRLVAPRSLPEIDPWLVAMLREDFSWKDVVTRCKVAE